MQDQGLVCPEISRWQQVDDSYKYILLHEVLTTAIKNNRLRTQNEGMHRAGGGKGGVTTHLG